jgi:hypothetical protein
VYICSFTLLIASAKCGLKGKPTIKQRRKALKKQLQYLKRNLDHIEQLLAEGASLQSLKKRDYKLLLVVTEV